MNSKKCLICGRTKNITTDLFRTPLCEPYNSEGYIVSNCKWIYAELMEHNENYNKTKIPDVEVVSEC